MEFIKNLFGLFNEIFIGSLTFEPLILLFVVVCCTILAINVFEFMLKGKYTK